MGRHCRYIAQVDFVCLRKVMGGAIRSVFFMILMFFFRFPHTHLASPLDLDGPFSRTSVFRLDRYLSHVT